MNGELLERTKRTKLRARALVGSASARASKAYDDDDEDDGTDDDATTSGNGLETDGDRGRVPTRLQRGGVRRSVARCDGFVVCMRV